MMEINERQIPRRAEWIIVISNYSLDELCRIPRHGLDDIMIITLKWRCGNDQDRYRKTKHDTPWYEMK